MPWFINSTYNGETYITLGYSISENSHVTELLRKHGATFCYRQLTMDRLDTDLA